MSARDKLAKIIFEGMIGRSASNASLAVADQIIAALPGIAPPLVWKRHVNGHDDLSESSIGSYSVGRVGARWIWVLTTVTEEQVAHIEGEAASREAAKAAANALYVKQLMAGMGLATEGEA